MTRSLVLRARKAPAVSGRLLARVGSEPHVEHLAEVLRDSLFLAQDHRPDVRLYLLLEAGRQPVTFLFDTSRLGSLRGLSEAGLLGTLHELLKHREQTAGGRGQTRELTESDRLFDHHHPATGVRSGVLGFDLLMQRLASSQPCYLLHPKGQPIQEAELGPDPCFVLTDHIPMPDKSLLYLRRLGCVPLSLGRRMLRASQAVTLVHHYCDIHGL